MVGRRATSVQSPLPSLKLHQSEAFRTYEVRPSSVIASYDLFLLTLFLPKDLELYRNEANLCDIDD